MTDHGAHCFCVARVEAAVREGGLLYGPCDCHFDGKTGPCRHMRPLAELMATWRAETEKKQAGGS